MVLSYESLMSSQSLVFYLLLLFVGTAVVIYLMQNKENFDPAINAAASQAEVEDIRPKMYPQQGNSQESPEEQIVDALEGIDEAEASMAMADVSPKELLPADNTADQWAEANPQGAGTLEMKNFLEAGYHTGVDTQSNSLRNANQSLRSDPPIPVAKNISPWQKSSMQPDPYRKNLSIGQ